MTNAAIRIYCEPPTTPAQTVEHAPKPQQTVSMSFGELTSLLTDALDTERTWVGDFADDEVTLSSDLYDVLMAYRSYRSA